MLRVTDPRGDTNAKTTNPQTGTQHIGGQIDVMGVDLGNGFAALATIAVVRTPSTVAGAITSTQLLAADSSRLAVSVANTDVSSTLYLGVNGAAAVVGVGIAIPPGSAKSVPVGQTAGVLNGIWTAGVTGSAKITATTA